MPNVCEPEVCMNVYVNVCMYDNLLAIPVLA